MARMLTIPEAAEYLGVDAKSIRAYIHNGELQAWNKAEDPHTSKPRYRVSVKALDAFVDSRTVKVMPATPPRRRWPMADIV